MLRCIAAWPEFMSFAMKAGSHRFWNLKCGALAAALFAVLNLSLVNAAPGPDDSPPAAAAVPPPSTASSPTNQPPESQKAKPEPQPARTGGIEDIQQMIAAGVSKEVVKTYIENVRITRSLTPSEMISLKEHGVPDEVTTALLKRAAELKEKAKQAQTAEGFLNPWRPGTAIDP